ncbi:hypothetical protein [Chromobacterium vaccinii]|uniref:hypothetical protein n=1 Tax=Chromobacterium vaccinii TaxID=1108595 RepID=UPI001364D568|nr:hypothetical protein [Chromobacterium vaccinii]
MLPLLEMRLSGKAEAESDVDCGWPSFTMPAAIHMLVAWYFQSGGGAIYKFLECRYLSGKYGFHVLKYSFIIFRLDFLAWLYSFETLF